MTDSEKKDVTPPKTEVYMGKHLKELPEERKLRFAEEISNMLAQHKKTMLQYTPEELKQIMDEGRAVAVVDIPQNAMSAFAQVSPWLDSKGKVAATEFRTWLSNRPGTGGQALRGAVTLNQIIYPGITMYTVVEESNKNAQQIFTRAGAREVPMPDSMKVVLKAGNQPAPVKTYDLTNVRPINRAA